MSEPTPGPWVAVRGYSPEWWSIHGPCNSSDEAIDANQIAESLSRDDAEYIVRCVNAHVARGDHENLR